MTAPPTMTVFVLTRPTDGDERVERTLRALNAGDVDHPLVHVVPSSRLTEGLDVSPGRQVNDLLATDSSDLVALVTAGSVVHPDDLRATGQALRPHARRILSGRTHEITAPRADTDLKQLWAQLRVGGGSNRLDVSEVSGSTSLLLMHRSIYVELRGLDDSIPEARMALSDLESRALRAGVTIEPGPLVLRVARKLNAMVAKEPVLTTEGAGTRPPIYRNLHRSIGNPAIDAPAVSIVISTFNRAPYLSDCINSILAQSMPDFELVLVDDGSTDDTEAVVAGFEDPRIRYVKRENSGISAARNFALGQARGPFIAVHDDDDIMLPWRLGTQLSMMQPGDHGCYGISVHFDEVTGETHSLVHRLFTMETALRYGNNPTHPTWMLRRDVMAAFRYDESIESGVDNNLALRMLRSGIRMAHTGVPLILRRLHTGQITRTAGETQKASAGMSRRLLQFASAGSVPPSTPRSEWLPPNKVDDRIERVLPYLPDHLVRRSVTIRLDMGPAAALALVREVGELQFMRARFGLEGQVTSQTVLTVTDVSWPGLAALRGLGAELEVTVLTDDVEAEHAMDGALEQWSVQQVAAAENEGPVFLRIISSDRDELYNLLQQRGVTGWAYVGVREGEQRLAVVVDLPDLAAALTLQAALEGSYMSITEISILSREPIVDEVVHEALLNQKETQP